LLGKLGDVLDEGQLEVLVCRYLDEMTQDEIADHLGLSRKTVGKRLARAHEAIAELTAAQAGGAA
jgi:RNA polymerase sigma factor (sigma-70 family)